MPLEAHADVENADTGVAGEQAPDVVHDRGARRIETVETHVEAGEVEAHYRPASRIASQ